MPSGKGVSIRGCEEKGTVRLADDFQPEHTDGLNEGFAEKKVHLIAAEPELFRCKRPHMVIELEDIKDPLYSPFALRFDLLYIRFKTRITASFFVLGDKP